VTQRLSLEDLPSHFRHEIQRELGARIVDSSNCKGGYSPSLAAVCRLDDGRMVFVKAVSPAQNPDTPNMLRREASVTALLPPSVPAPRLLHVLEDGEWIATIYEYAEGSMPAVPWKSSELAKVIGATWALAEVGAPKGIPTLAEHFGEAFTGWRNLVADPGPNSALDPWSLRFLDRLAALEPSWLAHADGDELVHGDVRSDNVLLSSSGVMFVDWSSACTGRSHFDVVCMLPSIALEGGGSPEEVLALHGGSRVDPDAITSLAVACAGYLLDHARRPDPPGLPTVRAFQRAQGEVAVAWLRSRLGWR
jgi:hypothetical protein